MFVPARTNSADLVLSRPAFKTMLGISVTFVGFACSSRVFELLGFMVKGFVDSETNYDGASGFDKDVIILLMMYLLSCLMGMMVYCWVFSTTDMCPSYD